jgi:type III secretory pathway component EscV
MKIAIKTLGYFVVCCLIIAASAFLFFISFKLNPSYPVYAGESGVSLDNADISLNGAYIISIKNKIVIKANIPLPRILITPKPGLLKDKQITIRLENIPVEAVSFESQSAKVLEQGQTFTVFSCTLDKPTTVTFAWKKKDISFIVWGDSRNSASILNTCLKKLLILRSSQETL